MHVRYLDYPGDANEILRFMPELYERNFPGFVADKEFLARKRAQLREAARDPGQCVMVAVDDQSRICGFIWLIIEVAWGGGRQGEVSAIHVDPQARSRGVGRRLMEEGETILRSYGCDTVHLMVTASNELAMGLYSDLGYQVTRHQMEKPLK